MYFDVCGLNPHDSDIDQQISITIHINFNKLLCRYKKT